MKIAAIYFGQPRFVHNHFCHYTQKELIFNQGTVDVFAHLWLSKDSSYSSSSWSGMNACPASSEDINTFQDKWNPYALAVNEEKTFTDPELFAKIKERFPDPHWNEVDFNKALAHLYSLEKAIELFEEKARDAYDFVIFLRTDLCIWNFPNLEDLEKDKFYFSSFFPTEHFADLCYISSPKYVSGLKAYSYLTDKNYEIITSLLRPCAEQFKKETFIKTFGRDPLKQIPIPVRVVRALDDKGKQW